MTYQELKSKIPEIQRSYTRFGEHTTSRDGHPFVGIHYNWRNVDKELEQRVTDALGFEPTAYAMNNWEEWAFNIWEVKDSTDGVELIAADQEAV